VKKLTLRPRIVCNWRTALRVITGFAENLAVKAGDLVAANDQCVRVKGR
jgi:hypothetical protein